ncbi:response regulator [Pseudoalteromonas sp. T1lg65]|uniref:PAS domain-containing hybrid sensor histidine kinase/response regulator n=1 Tax=Pseudoalteromonas sp. T1lg65 TaxID=2077101 RepID=UPI003F7B3326
MVQLRTLFLALFALMFTISLVLFFVTRYANVEQQSESRLQEQLIKLSELTRELKLISDKRSLYARAYIVTGESRWLTLFEYALAASEGRAALPDQLQLDYWDKLALNNAAIPPISNEKISRSLIQRFEDLNVTSFEYSEMQQALLMSKDLVEIEREAIKHKQQFLNNQTQASHLFNQSVLFSEAYLQAKQRIMTSLSETQTQIYQRIAQNEKQTKANVNYATTIQNIIIATLLLSICVSFYLLWQFYIRPLSKIQKALVAKVDEKQFDFQLETTYHGELAQFSKALNSLLSNISEQLKFSAILKDFGSVLRGKHDILELSEETISFIGNKLAIPLIGLYVLEEHELRRISGIGFNANATSSYRDTNSIYFHTLRSKERYSINSGEMIAIDHHGTKLQVKELHYFPLLVADEAIGLLELGTFTHLSPREFQWLSFIIRDLAVSLHLTQNLELQRNTERMVLEQLELNKKIIDAIPNPMYYRSRDGIYLGVNRSFNEFIGTFDADVIGASPSDIFTFDIATRFNESEHKLLNNPGSHDYEMKIQNLHGELRDVVVYEATFSDADNEAAGIVGLLLDVTERKEMEKQLRDAKQHADSTSKAKGEFLANMSHEIRTPMNAIIGMSHLVLKTNLNKKQQNYVKKIDVAANNLLGIINDILDFSKIESGKLEISQDPFELDEVMTNVSVVNAIKAEEKGLELLLDIAPTVPRKLIGDPLRLSQVLINLCGNAIKFTEHGEIILTAKLIEQNSQGVTIQFSVKDSGIGLTPEQQAKLFHAFSQADGSITRKYGGTGLGLSISKQLVELMGGEIGVHSELGSGSEFYFTIQCDVQSGALTPDVHNRSFLLNKKALVVDDNEAARSILSNLLINLGLEVVSVHNGREAIAEAEIVNYDLIFMDWNMPGLNGGDTTKKIRNQHSTHRPFIILVTAYSKELEIDDELAPMLDGIVTKPMNASLLLDCIMDCYNVENIEQNTVKKQPNNLTTFNGESVLLVEDNITNQEVATEMLSSVNLAVDIANNGEEALQLIATNDYQLVLMDMQMPVMDGITATKNIRAQSQFDAIPIIAMTANALQEDKEVCIQAGMNDHLSKPICFERMIATITKYLYQDEEQTPKPQTKPKPRVEEDENSEFIEIEGIDINDGIDRIGGNESAYWKILSKFLTTQIEEVINLEQALIVGDLEHAHRIAHTLKGSASNLSAHYLAEQAQRFEAQLKASQSVDIDELHQLANYLRTTAQQLNLKLTQQQNKQTAKQDDNSIMFDINIDEKLNHLISLVDNNDAEAMEVLDYLAEHSKLPQSRLNEVKDKLQDFEFLQAKELLIKVKEQLNI